MLPTQIYVITNEELSRFVESLPLKTSSAKCQGQGLPSLDSRRHDEPCTYLTRSRTTLARPSTV